jgi:fatty acid desaturase
LAVDRIVESSNVVSHSGTVLPAYSTGESPFGSAISRPPGMPIPNRLNFGLLLLVFAAAAALLWLGSRATTWPIVFAIGVAFSYLLLSNYALLHEATHLNLHDNLTANYWLGVWAGILFPVPFTLIHLTHQGHHLRNRTDAEMFDLYYPTDNRLYKYWIWYGTLTGWFWPLVPIGAVLLAVLPYPLYKRLFTRPPWSNPSLETLTSVARWRIRFECLLIGTVWALLVALLDLRWSAVLVSYACFSFNWSTRQYVSHAFTTRHVIDGALNLKHNRVMEHILLNGQWDLNHHRHPDVSWYYLPQLSVPQESRPSYRGQYWRQWRGPCLTNEPSP